MDNLKKVLEERINELSNIVEAGVIPGELDSFELRGIIGRIDELRLLMTLITKED